jgi:nucleotide-binding universal stress UspA family protein
MIVLKNVLVATDFEGASGTAIDYGRDLARSYGATLHVLHVVEPVLARLSAEVSIALVTELQTALDTTARERMKALITEDDRRTLDVVPAIVTATQPADAIVQYAKEHGIDLVVMGTHGRRGFTHMIMGSVAERVVRMAPCPVLTVRQPEREFIGPDALVASATA